MPTSASIYERSGSRDSVCDSLKLGKESMRMRPNLSIEKIAGALAVLGTSALIASCCGSDKPADTPVKANEVSPASPKSSEGASSCGSHSGGAASCGAAKAGDAKPGDAQ